MSLSSITPDLLGFILAFDSVNYASLPLWLSGNKALQHQLAAGVTKVVLKNPAKYSICRVPIYLQELRHLRDLELERKDEFIMHPGLAWRTLSRLNPGLTRLCLVYSKSFESLDPYAGTDLNNLFEPTETPTSSVEEPRWTLKQAYPHLQTLEIHDRTDWNATVFEGLPSSLTSLSTHVPIEEDEFKAFLAALPHSLVRLVLYNAPTGTPIEERLALLSHQQWQYLDLHDSPDTYLEPQVNLPPTLTELSSNGNIEMTVAQINALPPGLTSLDQLQSSENEISGDGDSSNGSRYPTFGHLKALTSIGQGYTSGPHMTPETIRTLPPGITNLHLIADLQNIRREDWPVGLVSLRWTALTNHFPIAELPSRLVRLSIYSDSSTLTSSSISLLPRTLTLLNWSFGALDEEEIHFPPNLRYLDLTTTHAWVNIEPFDVLVDEEEESEEEEEDSGEEIDDGNNEEDEEAGENEDGDAEPKALEDDTQEEINEQEGSLAQEDAEEKPRRQILVPFDIRETEHYKFMPNRPKVTTCFPFHSLPQGLVIFYFPCMIPASKLKDLPPRLEALVADDIFEDSEFDSKSPENLAYMHRVYEIGKREAGGNWEKDFVLSPLQAQEASPASLLPRTLTTWHLTGDSMTFSMDWPRIPPRLASLQFGRWNSAFRPIPADFFLLAPLSCLNHLEVHVSDLRDVHIRALSRKLEWLKWLRRSEEIELLTPDCADYWPVSLFSCSQPDRFLPITTDEVKSAVAARKMLLRKAIADHDLSTLRKQMDL